MSLYESAHGLLVRHTWAANSDFPAPFDHKKTEKATPRREESWTFQEKFVKVFTIHKKLPSGACVTEVLVFLEILSNIWPTVRLTMVPSPFNLNRPL